MDNRLVLPVNTVLDGSYRITRVVGSGGFGITYEAEDLNLGTLVAVKEYYPFDFGERDATMSVKPKSDRHQKTFEWGRSNFLQEARTLARFEHPSIVRITRVFEANSTAYMVMRFEQGLSFESWLVALSRPPTQRELDSVTAPLLDALQLMHAADFLHRDIAPDNIIIRADGSPVLLDFGAARRSVAEMSRSLTGIVKAGYSPHEQYSSDSRLQGPWSDLYALGGTLYRAVCGRPPEEATLRFDEDHMMPAAKAAKGKYRHEFLAAIDACLKVRHAERPRSVAQLRPMLLGPRSMARPQPVPPAPRSPGKAPVRPVETSTAPKTAPKAKPRTILNAILGTRPTSEKPRRTIHLFTDLLAKVRSPSSGLTGEKVFISYRRDDSSGYAGRLHDRLEREFGGDRLFMDVDAIALGEDFTERLAGAVGECGILLAVIGPSWVDACDDNGRRRLDDPNDFVRIEVAAALERDIPVIPLLFDGAPIPRAEHLPEDLKRLTRRHGLDVRHRSFHADIDKLVQFLRKRWGLQR